MKIQRYCEISEQVQVSDLVMETYERTILQIKNDNSQDITGQKNRSQDSVDNIGKKKAFNHKMFRAAVIFGSILLVSGAGIVSVKAFINHREKVKQLNKEEVVLYYENILENNELMYSREITEQEDLYWADISVKYDNDELSPENDFQVLASSSEYQGIGVALIPSENLICIPDVLTDEDYLEMTELSYIGEHLTKNQYIIATNPDSYLYHLEEMTDEEVDQCYRNFERSRPAVTCYYSRDLTMEEEGRMKALNKIYKNNGVFPDHIITVIEEKEDYTGQEMVFCTEDGTFHMWDQKLSDEALLQLIDYKLRYEYSVGRICEDIELGYREAFPEVDYVESAPVVMIDLNTPVSEEVWNQEWLVAYSDFIEKCYQKIYERPTGKNSYINISFIYLNDDDIPEMVYSIGDSYEDSKEDNCNCWNLLYTYKNGEVCELAGGMENMKELELYCTLETPFTYVERQNRVLSQYYYAHTLGRIYEDEHKMSDFVNTTITRVDTWNLDTLTKTRSNFNFYMEHEYFDYCEYVESGYDYEGLDDIEYAYEYYINVSDIEYDQEKEEIAKIYGEQVDKETYEEAQIGLWNGLRPKTLQVNDFVKLYYGDDYRKILALWYQATMQ